MNDETETVWCVDVGGGKSSCVILNGLAPTLTTTHYGEPVICYDKKDNDVTEQSKSGNDF